MIKGFSMCGMISLMKLMVLVIVMLLFIVRVFFRIIVRCKWGRLIFRF